MVCTHRLIAQYIQQAGVDIALLQEVFVKDDTKHLIATAAQGTLKYAQYMHSGFLGGELLILSRWPILYTRSVATSQHLFWLLWALHTSAHPTRQSPCSVMYGSVIATLPSVSTSLCPAT